MNKSSNRLFELLLLLIIVIVIFFGPNAIVWFKVNHFTNLLSIEHVASIAMPAESNVAAFSIDGKIIRTSPNQLSAYDLEGKLQWQRELFGIDTKVYSCGNKILIAEVSRGELALIDSDMQVTSVAKDLGTIRNITTTKDQQIILFMDMLNKIVILDNTLTEKTHFSVPFGDVIDLNLSQREDVILLSVATLEDNHFKSYVLQYDFEGHAIGTCDLEGQLIFSNYMSDYLIIITDSMIRSFNDEAQMIAEISGVGDIDRSTSYKNKLYATTMQDDENGEKTPMLMVYNDDLSYRSDLVLKEPADGIVINQKFIATYTEGTIYLYDYSFRHLSEVRTHLNLENVLWIDQNHLLGYDKSKIAIYAIK